MFISDNYSIIEVEGLVTVGKIDEKHFYNSSTEGFVLSYCIKVCHIGGSLFLFRYDEKEDARDKMFDRLQKILVE